jgi:dipeptidyl aminopeptidase/acylaminoacyl peptidase
MRRPEQVRGVVAALTLVCAIAAPGRAQTASPAPTVPTPAAILADGIPPVPTTLRDATLPYMEFRSANFVGWQPATRSMLVTTRFGSSNQLHEVKAPGSARTQLTFEPEPVTSGLVSPGAGDVTLAVKDIGGNENFQIYRLADGRLHLLTDGKSRHQNIVWSPDGRFIGFSSNARNGTDFDLYVMDPRSPGSARLVAERQGGGWAIADIAPDGKSAVVSHFVSVQKSDLHRLDLASGALTALTPTEGTVSYGDARFAPDGRLFATSDAGGDFGQLGEIIDGKGWVALGPPARWDVEQFDISPDGRTLAVVTNEAGSSKLTFRDSVSGAIKAGAALPAGVIGRIEFAPWGTLGLSLTSSRSPADSYSVDPATGTVQRWTQSETGGLDASRNVEPEFVRVKSFDGLEVTGFLYRPDPAKFPGKRPLMVNIHGGPEGQSRPGFLGRNNYLINERGVAIFYPNVRGSTGFGKRFVSLDNGPFKREDSVKDIAAFVAALQQDPGLDSSRFAVTGGSYGGYMTYGALTLYPKLWRTGLAVVAISDFVTFLENTAEYRRDLRRPEYGDERDPKQRAKLKEISPLGRADRIAVPLMVVTGANDPRVPASEADQIVAAVRAKGGTAWHLLAKNEGHGFAKKENQDYQFWTSLMFWEKTLLN